MQSRLAPDAPGIAMPMVMTFVTAVATFRMREPSHWRMSFFALVAAFGLMSLASFTAPIESGPFLLIYGIGLLLVFAYPLMSLLCMAIDHTNRERYDILHWCGIATLFGLVGHALAMIVV